MNLFNSNLPLAGLINHAIGHSIWFCSLRLTSIYDDENVFISLSIGGLRNFGAVSHFLMASMKLIIGYRNMPRELCASLHGVEHERLDSPQVRAFCRALSYD